MIQNFLSRSVKPPHRNRFTKFQRKLTVSESSDANRKQNNVSLNIIFFVVIGLLFSVICCHLPHDSILKVVKALAGGIAALYFSWEVVYFDSTTPGISPPSPLSPHKIRTSSEYAFHTSYLLPIINSVLFMIMIYLWL